MGTHETGNITRKLLLSFCLLILIFLVFGIYTLFDIHTISSLTRTIYNHPLVVSNAALQSNISITKMHRNMKDVVLFEDQHRIQLSIEKVNIEENQVYKHLDIVRNKILGDEGRRLEGKARVLFSNWKAIRDEVIRLVRSGQRKKAAEITIGKGAYHVSRLEDEMLGLTNYARTKASSFMAESEKTYSRLSLSSIVFLIAAIIISFTIALFTLKSTSAAENELRESRQLLSTAIDNAPIGMVLVEPGGRFYRVNQAYCEITGYSEKELLEMKFQDITIPEDHSIGPEIIQKLLNGEIEKAQLEKRYLRKNGVTIYVSLTTSLLKGRDGNPLYFFTQVQDITERKKADESMASSLAEKETLLKEIHHRVKNNMQMIQSIISLQVDRISDKENKQPLLDSINRIRMMSLVHESLYRTENLSRLNLKDYFDRFTQQIKKAYPLEDESIQLFVTVDPMVFDIDTVIVCGIIANELVTNSIKYAFNGLNGGDISIAFKEISPQQAELTVRDNGIGLPKDFDIQTSESLGLRIVRILSEGQLDGNLSLSQEGGVEYRVRFPINA